MSECSITLHVEEPQPITLNYVEAKIKPEVVGHATPTEQAQTVTPAPGTTFSAVEVGAIPPEYVVPSGTLDITENAEDINVRDKAAVNVNVQPNLQTPDPITPTKQQQIITPSAGHDGLAQAVVEPIPSEYIVPSGKVTLTENDTDVDISQYEKADIAVPVPVMPEEYATGGSITDRSITGYIIKRGATIIQSSTFTNWKELVFIDIPSTVENIGQQAFAGCSKLAITEIPQSLKELGQYAFFNCLGLTSIKFNSTPTQIYSSAFQSCGNLKDIYVPWAENEVANAPWGASRATIHYNYTGGGE